MITAQATVEKVETVVTPELHLEGQTGLPIRRTAGGIAQRFG
jgi:hypothetical protein